MKFGSSAPVFVLASNAGVAALPTNAAASGGIFPVTLFKARSQMLPGMLQVASRAMKTELVVIVLEKLFDR